MMMERQQSKGWRLAGILLATLILMVSASLFLYLPSARAATKDNIKSQLEDQAGYVCDNSYIKVEDRERCKNEIVENPSANVVCKWVLLANGIDENTAKTTKNCRDYYGKGAEQTKIEDTTTDIYGDPTNQYAYVHSSIIGKIGWLSAHKDDDSKTQEEKDKEEKEKNEKQKAAEEYCNAKYPDSGQYTEQCIKGYLAPDNDTLCTDVATQEACTNGQKAAKAAPEMEKCQKEEDKEWNVETLTCDDKEPEAAETEDTCKVEGIGWIVCPLANAMGKIADSMYEMLDSLLEIKSSMFNSGDAGYTAYKKFLPIANIVLAVLFIIIIYSEATGNGFGSMSNYSIKKLLPRLILFAIMINLSWYICAAMVDLSNIIGSSLKSFFDGTADGIAGAIGAKSGSGGETTSWESTTALVLVGAIGTGALASLSALLPMLIGVLVVLIAILVICIVRQALAVLLCVISPVAFAMAMLPNTQKLFNKWKSAFFAILITWPAVALIFGASTLASTILGDGGAWYSSIIALACRVLPLILVPFVILGSLNAFGKVGAAIGGFAMGRMSKQLGKAKGYAGQNIKNKSSIATGKLTRGMDHLATGGRNRVVRRIGKMGRYGMNTVTGVTRDAKLETGKALAEAQRNVAKQQIISGRASLAGKDMQAKAYQQLSSNLSNQSNQNYASAITSPGSKYLGIAGDGNPDWQRRSQAGATQTVSKANEEAATAASILLHSEMGSGWNDFNQLGAALRGATSRPERSAIMKQMSNVADSDNQLSQVMNQTAANPNANERMDWADAVSESSAYKKHPELGAAGKSWMANGGVDSSGKTQHLEDLQAHRIPSKLAADHLGKVVDENALRNMLGAAGVTVDTSTGAYTFNRGTATPDQQTAVHAIKDVAIQASSDPKKMQELSSSYQGLISNINRL